MIDTSVKKKWGGSDQETKKVSGGMVETRNQKASEDKKAMSEIEIHPNPVIIEYGRDVKTKEMGIEGLQENLLP